MCQYTCVANVGTTSYPCLDDCCGARETSVIESELSSCAARGYKNRVQKTERDKICFKYPYSDEVEERFEEKPILYGSNCVVLSIKYFSRN